MKKACVIVIIDIINTIIDITNTSGRLIRTNKGKETPLVDNGVET